MTTLDIVEAWNGPGRKDGSITTVSPSDNAAHPSPSKFAFEHWYFDAHLDDGHIVVGFLQTRELVTRKPGVELHVYSPDGTRREIVKVYEPSQASASVDKCDVKVGQNYAYAEFPDGGLPIHHVHIAEEDIAFDLEFRNEIPSWMPGRGQTSYGDDAFFAWAVGAPRARVSGTVRIGGKTLTASGRGYADHNWGVGDMKRIIDRWYWGRLYVDDFSLIYATVLTQQKFGAHESRPLMLAKGDQVVLSTGEVELTEGPRVFHEVANREYPSWIRLQVPGQVDLRLTVDRIVHGHDFLADVPVVRSRLVKPLANRLLGRPGYFRFHSTFELSIDLGGTTFERSGTTLHEMVALK
ncbi:lipocalin-like domain-containing protein [Rhodococcus sp. NPDC058514]|uniref:lipocalin-like domain-containing protein n=1 Tax=unclassified Rhodococcus (in: high G+C Gram-positive bacteria) TaxID=192944 RepID=UPI0036594C5D